MLLDGLDKVIIIFSANIFDAEVVDEKGEGDVTHLILPEGRGAGDRHISKLDEVDFQPVIGDTAGLFETRHAFTDLYIYLAVGEDEAAQVVLFDDLIREEI